MKKRTLLLVLLLSCFTLITNAQMQVALSSTDETCENNGTITVDVTNLKKGDYISLSLKNGDSVIDDATGLDPVKETSFRYTFYAKNSGVYTVEVRRDAGGTTETKEGEIEIKNKVEPLVIEATVKDICGGVRIEAGVSQGNPVKYRLLKPGGAEAVAWQDSNIIDWGAPFQEGNYKLQVKDQCDEIAVYGLTLKNPEEPNYYVERTHPINRFEKLHDCGHFLHKERLYFKPGTYNIPSYKYPIQVKIEVENPSDPANPTIINQSWSENHQSETLTSIPYYRNQTYNYKITFTDACGKTYTRNDVIDTKDGANFKFNKKEYECLINGLYIYNFRYLQAPLEITFLEAPAGFIPSEYNSAFSGNSMTGIYNKYLDVYDKIEIKNDTKSIPSGNYKIQIKACGNTYAVRYNIKVNSQFKGYALHSQYGCGPGNASVMLWISSSISYKMKDKVAKVIITKAPPAFVTKYGALPYNASYNIIPDHTPATDYDGRFSMYDLPPGDYKALLTGRNCANTVNIPVEFTLKERKFQPKVEVEHNCNSYNVNVELSSNIYYKKFFLQKYYEAAGKWGHPDKPNQLYDDNDDLNQVNAKPIGTLDGTSPGSEYGVYQTVKRSLKNVPSNGDHFGKHRVIMSYRTYGNGTSYKICKEVLKEFKVSAPQIEIINYHVLKCASTGNVTLLVEATGVQPLKYKIIEKNGFPTSAYPETEIPAWENLEEGTYLVEIKDKCGNTRTVVFSVERSKLPLIKTKNLCDGENGKIYLDGAGFLKIKWYKNGKDTGVEGIEYPFTPFNSAKDAGLYEAKLFFPSTNAEVCAEPVTLDLTTITANVEAGEGKTADVCSDIPFIDLFDYIEGPYNNWGEWSDPADTDALNGSIVDINQLMTASGGQGGTYMFDYIVKGHCTGEDNTSVTINLLKAPTITGLPAETCVGDNFTVTGSEIPHPEEPWINSNPNVVQIDKNGNVRVLDSSINPITITYKTDKGCTTSQSITVNALPQAPKYNVTPADACGKKGSIEVLEQSGCEYSIDGINYGRTRVFSNLDAGLYTIYVKNTKGCVVVATATIQMDSDCDGVGDNDDLDDDNDGILDTDEASCGVNLVQNPSFEAQNFLDGSVGTVWDGYGTYFGQDLNTDQVTGWNYTTNCDGWNDTGGKDMAPAAEGHQYMDVLGKDTRSTNPLGGTNTLYQVISTEAGKTYTFSFYWGEDMGNLQPPYLGETNLTASVINDVNQEVIKTQNLREMAEGNAGGIRGPKHWNFYTTTFVAVSNSTKIAFTAVATGIYKGTGAALDMVTVRKVCDSDGDGVPNHLDLDSDNDGCSDAKEGAKHLNPTHDASGTGLTDGNGNVVTHNLPEPVGTGNNLGIPTVAGSGQGIGSSQIKALAKISGELKVNSPCEGKAVVFKFIPEIEGVGWRYKLQKKEGENWVDKKEGDITASKELAVTLTEAAGIDDSGTYRIKVTNVNNICVELYREVVLKVHPIPTFTLEGNNAQCSKDSSEIKVTITSGADIYDIYLYLNGEVVDKELNKKITDADREHVFVVFTSGKYSVKVFNKSAEDFNRCDSGCTK